MSIALKLDDTVPDGRAPTASRGPTVDITAWFDDALPRIYGYFIPRVGERVAVAEDLTQETMLAAVRTDRGPESADSVMSWLYGFARHKLMDHYRRQDRDRRHFGHRVPEDDVPEGEYALPDINLESIPVRDAVIATLDALNPRQPRAVSRRADHHLRAILTDLYRRAGSGARDRARGVRPRIRSPLVRGINLEYARNPDNCVHQRPSLRARGSYVSATRSFAGLRSTTRVDPTGMLAARQ